MLNFIIEQLKDVKISSENIRRAKGKYKFPNSIKDFTNYIKTRL